MVRVRPESRALQSPALKRGGADLPISSVSLGVSLYISVVTAMAATPIADRDDAFAQGPYLPNTELLVELLIVVNDCTAFEPWGYGEP